MNRLDRLKRDQAFRDRWQGEFRRRGKALLLTVSLPDGVSIFEQATGTRLYNSRQRSDRDLERFFAAWDSGWRAAATMAMEAAKTEQS